MYLVCFGVTDCLGIFRLFDVFHHFPDEGVAIVLILGHDDLKDKPKSPDNRCKYTFKVLFLSINI